MATPVQVWRALRLARYTRNLVRAANSHAVVRSSSLGSDLSGRSLFAVAIGLALSLGICFFALSASEYLQGLAFTFAVIVALASFVLAYVLNRAERVPLIAPISLAECPIDYRVPDFRNLERAEIERILRHELAIPVRWPSDSAREAYFRLPEHTLARMAQRIALSVPVGVEIPENLLLQPSQTIQSQETCLARLAVLQRDYPSLNARGRWAETGREYRIRFADDSELWLMFQPTEGQLRLFEWGVLPPPASPSQFTQQ